MLKLSQSNSKKLHFKVSYVMFTYFYLLSFCLDEFTSHPVEPAAVFSRSASR